jgi:hypothetical protein
MRHVICARAMRRLADHAGMDFELSDRALPAETLRPA